jgi:hypothetical protein
MRGRGLALLVLSGLLGAGCYDFHPNGPEDPAPVVVPRTVSITIEYRQPNGCINVSTPCAEPVVFFGSWMKPGGEILLTPDPYTFVWRGVATGVPVNFPPKDQPYYVRVFDPFLREGPGGGVTAQRLIVGGELLKRFDSAGSDRESGLVYVDESGQGHSPF